MAQYPYYPRGAQLSAAITTNTTTTVNLGSGAIFAGAVVATAGSARNLEIYNGNPGSGGVLLVTVSADATGPINSPLLSCPQGLYVVSAGTTPGSAQIAFYA